MPSQSQETFEVFLEARHAAAAQFVCGDPGPLTDLLSTQAGSFFGPLGGQVVGAEAVADEYRRAAGHLRNGEYRFEVLASGVSGDMAWLVGLQKGALSGNAPDRTPQLDIRVTEIYRCEAGRWRLIHRHGDPLIERGAFVPPPG